MSPSKARLISTVVCEQLEGPHWVVGAEWAVRHEAESSTLVALGGNPLPRSQAFSWAFLLSAPSGNPPDALGQSRPPLLLRFESAMGCKLGFGGNRELQAAGTGGCLARCCGETMRCRCRAGGTAIAVAKSGAERGGWVQCVRNRLRGSKGGSSDGQKRAIGTPPISLGPALAADSLCRWQEKRTMCETDAQNGNSGLMLRNFMQIENEASLLKIAFVDLLIRTA
jgi:hypothetical protein